MKYAFPNKPRTFSLTSIICRRLHNMWQVWQFRPLQKWFFKINCQRRNNLKPNNSPLPSICSRAGHHCLDSLIAEACQNLTFEYRAGPWLSFFKKLTPLSPIYEHMALTGHASDFDEIIMTASFRRKRTRLVLKLWPSDNGAVHRRFDLHRQTKHFASEQSKSRQREGG